VHVHVHFPRVQKDVDRPTEWRPAGMTPT
jgi:hypothetical protein